MWTRSGSSRRRRRDAGRRWFERAAARWALGVSRRMGGSDCALSLFDCCCCCCSTRHPAVHTVVSCHWSGCARLSRVLTGFTGAFLISTLALILVPVTLIVCNKLSPALKPSVSVPSALCVCIAGKHRTNDDSSKAQPGQEREASALQSARKGDALTPCYCCIGVGCV